MPPHINVLTAVVGSKLPTKLRLLSKIHFFSFCEPACCDANAALLAILYLEPHHGASVVSVGSECHGCILSGIWLIKSSDAGSSSDVSHHNCSTGHSATLPLHSSGLVATIYFTAMSYWSFGDNFGYNF